MTQTQVTQTQVTQTQVPRPDTIADSARCFARCFARVTQAQRGVATYRAELGHVRNNVDSVQDTTTEHPAGASRPRALAENACAQQVSRASAPAPATQLVTDRDIYVCNKPNPHEIPVTTKKPPGSRQATTKTPLGPSRSGQICLQIKARGVRRGTGRV